MIALAFSAGFTALVALAPALETWDEPPPLCWINPQEANTMAATSMQPDAFMTAGGLYMVAERDIPASLDMFGYAAEHETAIRQAAAKQNIELGVGVAIVAEPVKGSGQFFYVAVPVLDAHGAAEGTKTDPGHPVLLRVPPAKVAHVRYEGVPGTARKNGTDMLNAFLAKGGATADGVVILEFYDLKDAKAADAQTIEVCLPFK